MSEEEYIETTIEKDISITKDYESSTEIDYGVKSKIPFWSQDPNILLKQDFIFEFYPTKYMTFAQKLNAITRSVILATILLYFYSRNFLLIPICAACLFSIYMMWSYRNKKEGFSLPVADLLSGSSGLSNGSGSGSSNDISCINKMGSSTVLKDRNLFDKPNPKNPFSNVLMTDYTDRPDKFPAPSTNDIKVTNTILENAKKTVAANNTGQPDIVDKLFRDLGEQLTFEQSMRQFNCNPSTTIPNDQEAFANFCYGNMVSCREGNAFACARNLNNHHTLY